MLSLSENNADDKNNNNKNEVSATPKKHPKTNLFTRM